MNLEFGQIFTQIIAFLIMLWVLKRFGWKPLLNLLDERRQTIQNEFDTIAKQKEENEKILGEYKEKIKGIEAEARHKIQEAVTEGRKIASDIEQHAQLKAKELHCLSQVETERELAIARKKLKNDIVNMAIAISEKILQERLDDATQKKLIAEFVEKTELQ